MSIEALRNAQYKDLGEAWYSHQVAQIVQRHVQFGRHCRLDLDALLAGMARRIRRTTARPIRAQHFPDDANIANHLASGTREQTGQVEA